MATLARSLEDRVFTTWRLRTYGTLLAGLYFSFVAFLFAKGIWVNAAGGPPREIDFTVFWSAGRLALEGAAASAYDWPALAAAQYQVAGGEFGALPWVYPPTFLVLIAPFAMIPYSAAVLTWLGITLAGYIAALYRIVPHPVTAILALASPPVLWNVSPGQNGFLTASLLAGSLALLETWPAAGGLLLGLLTYKPQFGLLFPLVLILTRQWRALACAALSAAVFAAVSCLAFGPEAWMKFLASGTATTDAVFSGTVVPWAHIQSIYSVVRWLNGGAVLAVSIHAAVALAIAVLVARLWMSSTPYALKAAALAAATLIVTPRLLVYDMTALAVPIAFLVKHCLATGFRRGERTALFAISVAMLILAWGWAPFGWLPAVSLFGLVALRGRSA